MALVRVIHSSMKILWAAMALGIVATASAQWQPILKKPPAIASEDKHPAQDASAEASVKDGFTLVVGGDLLGPYHPRLREPDAERDAVFRLFQSADVGFANLEGNLFDTWKFRGYPAAENGG